MTLLGTDVSEQEISPDQPVLSAEQLELYGKASGLLQELQQYCRDETPFVSGEMLVVATEAALKNAETEGVPIDALQTEFDVLRPQAEVKRAMRAIPMS